MSKSKSEAEVINTQQHTCYFEDIWHPPEYVAPTKIRLWVGCQVEAEVVTGMAGCTVLF